MAITEFTTAVIEKIGYYVYTLSDPQTETVFYVGKGTGNRVFAHARDALEKTTSNDRLDRIRAIMARGDAVQYEILRHGLTDKEAFEVESTLIDYIGLDSLANEVRGMHAETRGRMRIVDIIAEYDAQDINITEPMLLLRISHFYSHGIKPELLYEYTRGNWILDSRRKNRAEYASTVYRGIVREVYQIHTWSTTEVDREGNPYPKPRWRFDGCVAEHLQHYIGGRVEHLIAGTQNPVRYINCD